MDIFKKYFKTVQKDKKNEISEKVPNLFNI